MARVRRSGTYKLVRVLAFPLQQCGISRLVKVVKRARSLYHSRQCGIVLTPHTDGLDYTVVCLLSRWRTIAAKSCEKDSSATTMLCNRLWMLSGRQSRTTPTPTVQHRAVIELHTACEWRRTSATSFARNDHYTGWTKLKYPSKHYYAISPQPVTRF